MRAPLMCGSQVIAAPLIGAIGLPCGAARRMIVSPRDPLQAKTMSRLASRAEFSHCPQHRR